MTCFTGGASYLASQPRGLIRNCDHAVAPSNCCKDKEGSCKATVFAGVDIFKYICMYVGLLQLILFHIEDFVKYVVVN